MGAISIDPSGSRTSQHRGDQCHGESDRCHGKSDRCHGESDRCHGESDQCHGESDQCHGESDQCHRERVLNGTKVKHLHDNVTACQSHTFKERHKETLG